MHNTEKVIKHLEMIQRYIIRYGFYSFMIKGGSLLLVITAQVLLATLVYAESSFDHQIVPGERSFISAVAVVLFAIVTAFWLLDAYFLQGERLFRHHYDTVRQQDNTDLNMYVSIYKTRPKGDYASAFFSVTLMLFYAIEIIFALFIPIVIILVDQFPIVFLSQLQGNHARLLQRVRCTNRQEVVHLADGVC